MTDNKRIDTAEDASDEPSTPSPSEAEMDEEPVPASDAPDDSTASEDVIELLD